jgi:hypothetical protein
MSIKLSIKDLKDLLKIQNKQIKKRKRKNKIKIKTLMIILIIINHHLTI